jgi:hypothetical protein
MRWKKSRSLKIGDKSQQKSAKMIVTVAE